MQYLGEIINRVSSETIITRFIELDLRLSDENGKLSDEKLNLLDIMSDELTKDILRPDAQGKYLTWNMNRGASTFS